MSETQPHQVSNGWPDYRAVWRWHFYASLFCIPFVVILSISGGLYLFKEEIERREDRPYDTLTVRNTPAAAADQVRAALGAVPDSTFDGYEVPPSENSAVRVIVRKNGQAIRVYVHPETLQILHAIADDERLMPVVRKVHGELLAGEWGSIVVELAASWTIIMIITGLYLWWPRRARGLAGVLYPRFGGGSRMLWRDLHAVTGVWICSLALFLLLSGLPWAKSWGNYLKAMRRMAGAATARQDWPIGGRQEGERRGDDDSAQHSGHNHHGGFGGGRGDRRMSADLSDLDRVVAAVRPLALPPPVVIAPPERIASGWSAKSMTSNRPQRVDLVVDGRTGDILSRREFRDRPLVDRIVGLGIAAHEGRLFGWPNQALGLLTAVGLDLLCVSGVVLWWKRREPGVLGAPPGGLSTRLSFGLLGCIVLLGVYLPLFGASLIGVLLLEKAVLTRVPLLRDWLGLVSPRTSAEG